jgi:hypothetical protein
MTRAAIVVIVMLLGAGTVSAQRTPRPAPSGGLFGATRTDVSSPNRLNFMFRVAESFESELPPQAAAQLSRLDNGGLSTMFDAGSSYSRQSRSFQLGFNVSTAFRYYNDLGRLDPVSHGAGLGASMRVPKGTLRLDQSAAYAPSYLYQLIPTTGVPALGEAFPTNPQYQLVDTESYSYKSSASLSFGSPRQTQLTTSGSLRRTDFQEQALNRADVDVTELGMKVSRRLAPSASFSAGYDYRTGEFGFGGTTTEHGIPLSFEYSPALSRTRRATFRLGVTPTRVYLPEGAVVVPAGATDTRLTRLSGDASVSYPFTANWRAEARYRRSTEYLSVVGTPVFSDAARVEVAGLLTRRLDLVIGGGYATAASAFSTSLSELQTYSGQATMRYALKRTFALFSEYMYYYYDQRGQATVIPGLPPRFEQHSVRLGAAVFLEPLR